VAGVDAGVEDRDVDVDTARAVARHGAGPLAIDPVDAGGQRLGSQVDLAVRDHSGHLWVGRRAPTAAVDRVALSPLMAAV
jgi:hypothetical protein